MLSEMFIKLWNNGLIQIGIWETVYMTLISSAIAYLLGEKLSPQELYRQVADTITNTIGTVGGMVCDGAKSSCAAKIATAVDCAITAYELSLRGLAFQPGEGLVMGSVEDTIESVGRMGREGMQATDMEILQIMLRENQ